eukprot:TRINITY_DN11675_c0_g2_i1.p1 TRINITY_DN11675_c0_g2~~TRINITY_DN11675_c0_g2_i1.p1  ORF type:complete len:197 (+),score=67.23 TRINITY_DN11675_c0_g2_i1:61-591(+)
MCIRDRVSTQSTWGMKAKQTPKVCPYCESLIAAAKIRRHMEQECKKKTKGEEYLFCQYDDTHFFRPDEKDFHLEYCESKKKVPEKPQRQTVEATKATQRVVEEAKQESIHFTQKERLRDPELDSKTKKNYEKKVSQNEPKYDLKSQIEKAYPELAPRLLEKHKQEEDQLAEFWKRC